MPRNFFITGAPRAGKTTILRDLIAALKAQNLKIGGFISPEDKHHGTRMGFFVSDIRTGRMARLADVKADGPKVSKYHVDIRSFESIAVPILQQADRYDVIIIDEIGRMELKSTKFSELLDDLLESGTTVIATLHHDFIGRYCENGELFELTESNREMMHQELLERVKEIHGKAMDDKDAEEEEEERNQKQKEASGRWVRPEPRKEKQTKNREKGDVGIGSREKSGKAARRAAMEALAKETGSSSSDTRYVEYEDYARRMDAKDKKEGNRKKTIIHHLRELIGL